MIEGFKACFPLGIIKAFKFLSQTSERLISSFSRARSYPENHANMFSLCRDPREVIVPELKAFETSAAPAFSVLSVVCSPGTLSPS